MIWRHLLGYLPANIISGLVSFGAVYAFTRLLGADDYGRYALVVTIMNATHTLTLTWSEAAAYRFAGEAEAKGGMADHLRTALGLSLISVLPAWLLIGVGVLLTSTDPKMQAALIWLMLSMPCYSIIQTSLEVHKARQQVSRFAFVSMGFALTGFFVGILVAGLTDLGAASPFVGLAFGGLIFAAYQGFDLWKQSKGGRFQSDRIKIYFKYGMPLAAALLLEIALSAGDRFIIQYFLGPEAVGAYAAGYGVADQTIRLLCMWGAMAGAPLLMAKYESHGSIGLREAGMPMVRMLMLIAFPATTGLIMVARPLAEFMIGEDLRLQAIQVIPWISLAGLLNGFVIYYFAEAFQLTHKTALRAGLMVIPAVLNVILNIILLPKMGLMGAVYATVACYAVALFLIAGVGNRLASLPFPMLDAAKTALACFIMAACLYALPQWGGLPELMLKAALGAIVFAISVYLLNAANAKTLVRDLIQHRRRKPED